jgi:hypothetical protein
MTLGSWTIEIESADQQLFRLPFTTFETLLFQFNRILFFQLSKRRRRRCFAMFYVAAVARHAEISTLQKNQLELNKSMFELDEAMIQIQKDEYLRSERLFSFDEEGRYREK